MPSNKREPICRWVSCGIICLSCLCLWRPLDKPNLSAHGLAEMPTPPRSPPKPIRVIDVLTYPAVQLLDVTGPVQVFASANDIVAETGGARPYALRVVARGGQGVTAS